MHVNVLLFIFCNNFVRAFLHLPLHEIKSLFVNIISIIVAQVNSEIISGCVVANSKD